MRFSQEVQSPIRTRLHLRHILLSLPSVVTAAVLTVILFLIPRSLADPDIWWHLRNAQLLLTTHTFLTHDLFSFTAPSAPWLNHEWLAELPFYLAFRIAGPTGIFALTVLLLELIFAVVLYLSYAASNNLPAAAILTVLAAIVSTVSFGPRTLLFGWLCLAVELLILQVSATKPRLILTLPALFAVWINLHGSWLIGFVVLLIHAAAGYCRFERPQLYGESFLPQQSRPLLVALPLCAAALLFNPYGWHLVAYPFNLAFAQKLNIANVQEWQPLDWHSPRGRVVLLVLALLVIRHLWRPTRWRLTDLALTALGLYSAVIHARFLFLFALLAAPAIARTFHRDAQEPQSEVRSKGSTQTGSRPRVILNAGIFLCLAGFVIGRFRNNPSDTAMQQFPTQAIQTLHPTGPLFHEYLWGGYLIWNRPQIPVFIDSRVDLFEANGTFADYLDIIHLHNSLQLLDRHHITSVLFEPDTPLVYLLQQTGRWQVVYQDPTAILMERCDPLAVATPAANASAGLPR